MGRWRVAQGSASVNDSVRGLNLDGKVIETGRLTKLLKFEGASRIPQNQTGKA